MEIGSRSVGPNHPAYIIAEAGSTHNGELKTAKELVEVAAAAGADAVKFQTFRASEMYPDGEDRDLYRMVAEAEMPYEWITELVDHCEQEGITFLSTPFDPESADRLDAHVPAFKIGSSSLSHDDFLRHLAETGKRIIASTGAHRLQEVKRALSVLQDAGASDVVMLHCVSSYPTPLEAINVRAVSTLDRELGVPVGFSDHTLNPTVAPSAAVSLGACVIEKHITLDRSQEGMDHSHSLEPDEFEEMVDAIRKTESALGDGEVTIQDTERDWYENARRSIQSKTDLEIGEKLTEKNVGVFRSASRERGLDPAYYDAILGAEVTENIASGQGIRWNSIDKDESDAEKHISSL